ncbi:MAG TPA: DUF998 domain-containing protein [Candidatus Limnocylindrales bacterium]
MLDPVGDARHTCRMATVQQSRRRRLALAGAVEAFWFLGLSLLLGLLRSGYDPTHDAISRLGEQGSSAPLLWNAGGFGIAAALYLTYAVAIAEEFGTGWLFLATMVQAVTIAGSAVFNCDQGCPPVATSTSGTLHTVFGLPYFAITCVVPLVAARTFRRRDDWRGATPTSYLTAILLVVLFLVGPFLGADRVGLWQRVVLLPALAWQAWISLRLHRLRSVVLRGVDGAP